MYLFPNLLLKNLNLFEMVLEVQDFEPSVEHVFGIKVQSQMDLSTSQGSTKNEERRWKDRNVGPKNPSR